ncbi:alpha/beta hydrolase [Rhodococcus artemisiae]|uniref:Alpha/beta hydrolase n=1 Tax=Rhodococcus artemisiae TaxID=714159 RepID=A0ABU7L8W1_9NOCA|nr:alpha/beta hydrolase [Rhodococcus artemisiae]MEE2057312.1 alpha/beta hydrolase [Rhodococcus artemisiae]
MTGSDSHDVGAGLIVRTLASPHASTSRFLVLILSRDHWNTCRELAADGLVIVEVPIRSGSALDDSDRALQWARSVATDLFDVDPGRIAVLDTPETQPRAAELAERVRVRKEPPILVETFHSTENDLHARIAALPEFAGPTEPAVAVHRRVEPATLAQLDHLTRWDTTSIDTIRASYAKVTPPPTPANERVERIDDVVLGTEERPGIPVRWYRPRGATGPLPAIVYFHGGAFIMGGLDENDDRLDLIATELGCAIVSVDYRLAPENPYPAALDDAETVWRHILTHSDALGVDPSRLVIGGASAGAGLAAALCIRLTEVGLPQPALQLLVYPMLDDREHGSLRALEGGAGHWGLWRLEAERHSWQAYLGELHGTVPPATAAPGRATPDDLRGTAPAFIGIGDVDALLDSNLHYAAQLSRAGTPVELHVYPGVIHGGFVARPRTRQTQRFLDDVYAALRRAFETGG